MTTPFSRTLRFCFFICILAVTLLAFLSGSTLRAEDEQPISWKSQVDALVTPLMEKKKAVGMVVGIITPEGKREFFCYGATKEGGPEPTPDTIFEIGSVSKPITALLLALMVENGEVKLDDPVQLTYRKNLWFLVVASRKSRYWNSSPTRQGCRGTRPINNGS